MFDWTALIAAAYNLMAIAALPACMITFVWGGWGVFYTCVSLVIATAGWLIWLAFTLVYSTGLEGLVFVIVPLAHPPVWIGAFLGFCLVRVFRNA